MKIKRFVRQRLFSICLSFWTATQAVAAPLPDIEAHQFQSTPIRMSKSGRVYLFEAAATDLPKTGNLVLIHDHDKPAMAFRVLQTDAQKSEYVGKRIRRYDQTGELKLNEKYFSIEKVSDLLAQPAPDALPEPTPSATPFPSITPIPPAIENDQELDGGAPVQTKKVKHEEPNLEIYDYDDELDGGTSPRNMKKDRKNHPDRPVQDEDEFDDPKTASEIDETQRLDPLKNMISVGAGFFRNMSNFRFAGGTHNGVTAAYTRTLSHDVFITAKAPQDSFEIEFGAGYYSRINMDQHNDVYKIVPLYAELHYRLNFSQTFALYFYAGAEYNSLLSTENVNTSQYPGDATTLQNIRGVQATLGTGILYNMGPQWYLRFNLGWDRMTAGLALKW